MSEFLLGHISQGRLRTRSKAYQIRAEEKMFDFGSGGILSNLSRRNYGPAYGFRCFQWRKKGPGKPRGAAGQNISNGPKMCRILNCLWEFLD